MATKRRNPAAQRPAGYSGTPLGKKLGIKPDTRLAVLDDPDGDAQHLLGLIAAGGETAPDLVRTDVRAKVDRAVVFVRSVADLKRRLPSCARAVFPDGTVWVCWPKKASGVPTDMREDAVREHAFPLGLVDVKVCAVDDIWSGLAVVHRKENRK